MTPREEKYENICVDEPLTKVCLIGSGNWGSAIATIVGRNCARLPFCESQVNMWVFEEDVTLPEDEEKNNDNSKTHKLSHVINQRHENVKYLPGIQLPDNVRAVPDLAQACQDATLLIFVLPHQFLSDWLPVIRKHAHSSCRAISLIKGLDFDQESHRPVQISQTITDAMGSHFRGCGVLMGANVADEVARGAFCESTLACDFDNDLNEATRRIFDEPNKFRVQHCRDVAGTEVCGALKNIVALGAGFCDGMDSGNNTKAALLRVGLLEMMRFAEAFFSNVDRATFWESCGVADLITTYLGGRNRRCAEAFARRRVSDDTKSNLDHNDCERLWKDIEAEQLDGQKLQGTLTAWEVYQVLEAHGLIEWFPLFCTVYEISFEGRPVGDIVQAIRIPARL